MRRLPALALPLLLAGCEGIQTVGAGAGRDAILINRLFVLFEIVTGIFFVLTMAFLFAAYWRRRGHREDGLPDDLAAPSKSPLLRIALFVWTGAVILSLMGLALASYFTDRGLAHPNPNNRPVVSIELTGNQWWWDVVYHFEDPSNDFRTANELHLPVGVPAMIYLKSNDVIHSFWVPNLAGKQDLIPGRVNDIVLVPERLGQYRGQCAEYCGLQHAHMALDVIVDTPADFARWMAQSAGRYIVTARLLRSGRDARAGDARCSWRGRSSGLLGPDRYNQLFTMHGTTMMFLFAVPVMEAMAVYLVPLMVGTRNIAFPRLNAFSYWMYLFGGVMLWVAFVLNIGPDAGWFAYTPLSGPQFSPGKRADIWAQMITFTEVAALAVAVEIVATILKQRAPGMTLARMPLFVWAMLVTAFMVIFSMPAVMLASSMLISDRLVGTHFYNPAEAATPCSGSTCSGSSATPRSTSSSCRRWAFVGDRRDLLPPPVFGYPAMVLSLVATGFLAFGLWVHHMFATGLPQLGDSFYTAASMTDRDPDGMQIFCWIATIWDGRPRFATPMLFVIGFIVTFVIGGLTGVMLARCRSTCRCTTPISSSPTSTTC
jgi:heme/copper-type cytochrome/quinol oxidase subunit 2